jgi:AcrR family transcriptional regulator
MADRNGSDNGQARRREAILHAAEKVFEAHGFAETTMDAVAAEAGVSKGSIYNYFPSKEDLVLEASHAVVFAAQSEAASIVESDSSPTDKMRDLVNMWFEWTTQHVRFKGVTLEVWAASARTSRPNRISDWIAKTYASWQDLIARVVQEGMDCGEFYPEGDARRGASLIMAICDGIVLHMILDCGLEIDEAFREDLEQAILDALYGRRAVGPATPTEETAP